MLILEKKTNKIIKEFYLNQLINSIDFINSKSRHENKIGKTQHRQQHDHLEFTKY